MQSSSTTTRLYCFEDTYSHDPTFSLPRGQSDVVSYYLHTCPASAPTLPSLVVPDQVVCSIVLRRPVIPRCRIIDSMGHCGDILLQQMKPPHRKPNWSEPYKTVPIRAELHFRFARRYSLVHRGSHSGFRVGLRGIEGDVDHVYAGCS